MDYQATQPEIPIVPIKPPNYFNKTLILSLTFLLIGFILGIITWAMLPFGQTKVITPSSQSSFQSETNNQKLPVSLSLLTNPIVYEWRGSVKGKLMRKDEHTFTLADDTGNSIIITDLAPNGGVFKTLFFNKINYKEERTSLKDIPIGSTLLGDFFIFRDGPNTAVGSTFVKQ